MAHRPADPTRNRILRLLNAVGALGTAAALATACTTPPAAPALLGCAQLDREIRATEDARLLAVQKRADPWKFVTPFAVSGVHVASKSAVDDADHWLAQLRAEAGRKRCTEPGPGRGVRDVMADQRPNADRIPTVR